MDLEKIAPIIEKIMKQTLEQKRYPFGFAKFRGVGNKVASGKLRNSISVVSKKVNEDETIIQVLSEEYAQWVQSGRLPGKKGVPVDALEKWIKDRGLTGRDKRGRFIKRRSFAFAIQKNIKKFGIRPSNFLDVVLETVANDPKIMELIGDGAYEELIDLIQGI
jgi:hypothetical protein